jgi:hypothetical protein
MTSGRQERGRSPASDVISVAQLANRGPLHDEESRAPDERPGKPRAVGNRRGARRALLSPAARASARLCAPCRAGGLTPTGINAEEPAASEHCRPCVRWLKRPPSGRFSIGAGHEPRVPTDASARRGRRGCERSFGRALPGVVDRGVGPAAAGAFSPRRSRRPSRGGNS